MIDDASSVSNRTRYLLRGSYRFCNYQDFGLTGYNELFVALNSVERGPRAGFIGIDPFNYRQVYTRLNIYVL